MNKKKFVRAEEGKPPGISVIYYDTEGNMTIRYHDKNGKTGSIAWRNNNPGIWAGALANMLKQPVA